MLNKASQNAFVKLNKAVEVSNGVEIITVAMAGAGAGAQHHQLSKLTIEMLGVKYVSISDSAPLRCQLTPSISFMSISPCYSCTQGCPC